MKVFKAHKEPYYMEIESDSIKNDSIYDALKTNFKSLKSESIVKDKLVELFNGLEYEL